MSSLYGDLEHDGAPDKATKSTTIGPVDNKNYFISVNKSRLLAPYNVIRKKPQQSANSSWIQSGSATNLTINDNNQVSQQSDRGDTSENIGDHTDLGTKRSFHNIVSYGNILYDPLKPNEYEAVVNAMRKKNAVKKHASRPDFTSEEPTSDLSSSRSYENYTTRPPSPEPVSEPACSKDNPYMPIVHASRRMLIETSNGKPESDPQNKTSPSQNPAKPHQFKKSSPQSTQPLSTSTVLSGAPVVYQVPRVVAPSPLLKEKSEVIVLTNMVTPDDIDSNLRREVTEGCLRYGKVLKCTIHKPKNPKNEEDTVKIFVQFSDKASATRAVTGLNKRFFGGRVVLASFFSKERFLTKNFD